MADAARWTVEQDVFEGQDGTKALLAGRDLIVKFFDDVRASSTIALVRETHP